MGKLSLRYFGPVVWETMLPEKFKNIDNLGKFENDIKGWIPECKCRLCKTYVASVGFIGISKWHVSSLKPLSMLLTISSWFIIVWVQWKLLQTIIVNTVYSCIYNCHFSVCFYCVIDMCIMLLWGGWGEKWVLKRY